MKGDKSKPRRKEEMFGMIYNGRKGTAVGIEKGLIRNTLRKYNQQDIVALGTLVEQKK